MVKKCPECNHYISDNVEICPHCGAFQKISENKPPKVNSCPHCGSVVNMGDSFCSNCGKKFEKTQVEQVNEVVATKKCVNNRSSVNEDSAQTVINKAEEIEQEYNFESEEIPKTWRNYKLPIFGGIFIVIFLGACLWYYNFSSIRAEREKVVADSQEMVRQDSIKKATEKESEVVNLDLFDPNTEVDIVDVADTAFMDVANDVVDDSYSKVHDFGLNSMYHHHLTGTFEDSSGIYPIELDFNSSGREITDVVYKNVLVGGKIRMNCTYFDFARIIVKGKDGKNDFTISIDCKNKNLFRGTATDGSKEFVVEMEANCQHD